MLLVVALWLTSFLASFLGVEMTLNPPKKAKKKKHYRVKFVCLGIIGLGLAIPQFIQQEKKEKAASSLLTEIKSNTSKPYFELFLNSRVEKQDLDPITSNALSNSNSHDIKMIELLTTGRNINLKKTRNIFLSIKVIGDSAVDHITIEAFTPWNDNFNIVGYADWSSPKQVSWLDNSSKSKTLWSLVKKEITNSTSPHEYIEIAPLLIPVNYPDTNLPVRFKIFGYTATPCEVNVLFKLE